jgi:hypothetical protein
VNVSKATLEGLCADELALLQPTPGYMRLLNESVLQMWKARKATVREEIAIAERAAKAVQEKLDRLDEAFLFERSVDIETYARHAEKLREELTLARIDGHSGQFEESDGGMKVWPSNVALVVDRDPPPSPRLRRATLA